MKPRSAAVALAVIGITAAGCSSASSTASPAESAYTSTQCPGINCRLAPQTSASAAAFTTPQQVTDPDGNPLVVTPVAAWWLPGNVQNKVPGASNMGLSTAQNGWFLILEVRARAVSAPAHYPAPIDGKPVVIAGEQSYLSASSDSTVWDTCLPLIESTVSILPGQELLDANTWDVPHSPAVLEWDTTQWPIPSHSTQPLPTKVQNALKTGNGC